MITQSYTEDKGIKIFSPSKEEDYQDYDEKRLNNLYAQEEKHFWFITRKEYILQKIEKYIQKESNIIEIGAGTGNVARYLKKNGYKNISVGEMHLNGLKYAQSYGIKECYQLNLLDTPFENEFDAMCLFDVLEHIDDDDLVIKNINKSLKKNGKLILTVPAHEWLWSRDDIVAGHKRRYNKTDLIQKLQKFGFEVVVSKYFFISITPLFLLRKILHKDTHQPVRDNEHNSGLYIHPIINFILLHISRLENKIHYLLPSFFGGSLFVIARKR